MIKGLHGACLSIREETIVATMAIARDGERNEVLMASSELLESDKQEAPPSLSWGNITSNLQSVL